MRIAVPLIVGVLAIQAAALLAMGHPPICTWGTVKLWWGVVQSAQNSQHIFDWYSFSHLIHGFIYYFVAWACLPRSLPIWRLAAALGIECTWEIIENTPFVIERYRDGTISLQYYGDSVINSLFRHADHGRRLCAGLAAAYIGGGGACRRHGVVRRLLDSR